MAAFHKKVMRIPISGTRTNPQTGQVITSSGNPSLDAVLGGGLPIGSICLIEEDKFITHSKVLAKYFVAEGILSKQSIFLGSVDDNPNELLKKLPQHCTAPIEEEQSEAEAKNSLRIAWRYTDLPLMCAEQVNEKIGHDFNLMEYMDPTFIAYAHIATWCDESLENEFIFNRVGGDVGWDSKDSDSDVAKCSSKELETDDSKRTSLSNLASSTNDKLETTDDKNTIDSPDTPSVPTLPSPVCVSSMAEQHFNNTKYYRLLKDVNDILEDERFNSEDILVQRSLCRICITSLGSPLWYDDNFDEMILKFFTILRAIIRTNISTCFITIPMHLVAKYDSTLVQKIRNLVDYSIELESFAGSEKETNPTFKDYHGLLHVHKITAINTLSAYTPETTDLAFKLKRKKFVIEKLHLPPDLKTDPADKQDVKPSSSGSSRSRVSDISVEF